MRVAFLRVRGIRPHFAVAAALLALWSAPAVSTVFGQASEHHIKSAFVVNFLQFVEWDAARAPAADGEFNIAVVGDPAFTTAVERQARQQTVLGRRVKVRAVSDLTQVRSAHLVFIAGSEQGRLGAIVRALEGSGALTVGDTDGFGQAGVVINLYLAGDRVRFEVNTAAAARARVRLSSQLLRIARLVG